MDKSALPFRAAACGFADGSFCCEYRGPANMESERDDMGPSAELRQLMTRLSLANSKALAAVIEVDRSEEHTSELQSLMRISYAVFCLKKKNKLKRTTCNKQK